MNLNWETGQEKKRCEELKLINLLLKSDVLIGFWTCVPSLYNLVIFC